MQTKLQGKKILITGGAGFIGSHLCGYFLKENEIVCLDNFSTGFKENIQTYLSNPKFTFIEGDIRNFETCLQAVSGVDVVLHQAAIGSVPRSIENPIFTNENNINGFLNMLEASKQKGIKRFIYAASSSTYGDSTSLPKVEEKIGKPLSPYAITKYVNELYASVYSNLYGIECIGLRYFNVFGKNQSPNGAYAAVIPKFIDAFKKGEPIKINGDGNHTRDFTHINNVIQANEKAVLMPSREKPFAEVYNISYGSQISLNKIVKILQKEMSALGYDTKKSEIIHGPERLGDIKDSYASIEKAKKDLGYFPIVDLREGLKEILDVR